MKRKDCCGRGGQNIIRKRKQALLFSQKIGGRGMDLTAAWYLKRNGGNA